jgi:hypothetical protein
MKDVYRGFAEPIKNSFKLIYFIHDFVLLVVLFGFEPSAVDVQINQHFGQRFC